MIKIDKIKMEGILFNVVMNAFKFSKKISMSFSYDKQNTMFQICVADDGPGVESKNFDAIFKPFNKVRRKHLINLP